MSELEIFTEIKCGANLAYILKDSAHFLTTEYKVLQSRTGGCFLKSMKMTYNGRTELYYMTEEYKTFAVLAPVLDTGRFLTVAGNLLDAVAEVKDNGFLSCRNLDISPDKIYIDLTTYKVRLVYLPVSEPFFPDDAEFENELRDVLLGALDGRADKETQEIRGLADDLKDRTMKLEETALRLRGGAVRREMSAAVIPGAASLKTMHLVTMNAPRVELKVTKDEFVIGKKVSEVDGAVTFNRMISRVHCKIRRKDGAYTVTDLRSANGTYVNRTRLIPEQAYPVKNGDVIRLANTDFQVIIR